MAGEEAAARYEIDMIGLQGQVSRLEITSGAGRLRRGRRAAHHRRGDHSNTNRARSCALETSNEPSPHLLALNSLAEAIITTDAEGLITYMNPAAERLSGGIARTGRRQAAGGSRRARR